MAIRLTTGTPGSGMTLKHHISHCPDCGAPISVADEAYCANSDCLWNNKPSSSTPPVHQRGADGLPPVESPGLGVCIPDRPDLDFYDVFNPIILGWVVDVTTENRTSYPFGTCAHSADDPTTWYFLFDEFGWCSWPDAAGLMRGLHHALTGQKLPDCVCP